MAAIGITATAAAFFVFGGGGGGGAALDPIDAVPRESFLAASVDVAELRRSPIYDVLLGRGGGPGAKVVGLGDLEEACGFDPFTRIERLAVTVPEKEGERDFGIIARVEVSGDELQRCKRSLDAKRGTEASQVTERGSFVVIDGVRAAGNKGRLAYGKKNLLVVSTGEWFDAILDVANGSRPSVGRAQEHADLRALLTSHEGWRAPTIVVTAILPRSLRERIRGDMTAEAEGRDASRAAMAGVLGVSSIGLAVRAGPPGGHVDARIEMTCDSDDACAAVEKLVQKKRLDWSKDLALRMMGLGQVVDSLTTKQTGARLSVVATSSADMLASTIERMIKLRSRRGAAADDGAREPQPHAAPPRPDETVRAPDGG